jgi:hypothetical protein
MMVDYFALINGGVQYKDLRCISNLIGMPESVHAKISMTRAIDGIVESTWAGYSAFWNYHPDRGLQITFSEK